MKILFATDGSKAAGSALSFLKQMSLGAADSVRIVAVLQEVFAMGGSVVDPMMTNWETLAEVRQIERELSEQALAQAGQALSDFGIAVSTELREGQPAREILAAAEDLGADLVVVGSKGLTGLDSLLLGSVARNVAKHCPRPVLVAREPRHGLQRVVVATDGSENARSAVAFTTRLPLPEGTEITTVNVTRPYAPFPGLFPTDREQFNEAVAEVNRKNLAHAASIAGEAATALTEAGRHATAEAREGDPVTQILAVAEEQSADLVVAGARGVSMIQGLFLGSVAESLVREAACSVLIVR